MKLLLATLLTFTTLSGFTEKSYKDKLCELESNCNQYAVNQYGYLGKYQFGHAALVDIHFKTLKGKWVGKLGVHSQSQFLANLEAQEIALEEWNELLDSRLEKCGADKKIDTKFKGILLGKYNLRAASHLLGASYVCKLIHGNADIKTDANGTSVLKYLKEFE